MIMTMEIPFTTVLLYVTTFLSQYFDIFVLVITNGIFVYTNIWFLIRKSAHMTVEPDKSQDLQLISWRPRRAGGVVPVQKPADLRPRTSWHFRLTLKAGKNWCLSSRRSHRSSFLLQEDQLFCSCQAFNWLDGAHPHWGEQSALLGLLIQILI